MFSGDRLLPDTQTNTGDQTVSHRPPAKISIAPGQPAFVLVNRQACVGQTMAQVTTLVFSLPDNYGQVTYGGGPAPCSIEDHPLHVSPFTLNAGETTSYGER